MEEARVLDACCDSRMFWFDKQNDDVVYMDNRQLQDTLCDRRTLTVNPDVTFEDNSFYMVVFDPPHLLKAGADSWLAKKYGRLGPEWKDDIKRGFNECMRVLEPNGTLIFKWNEDQISITEILKAIDHKPLFGNRRSKTHWVVFMKNDEQV